MKKLLEKAQIYLDSGIEVPKNLIERMSGEERKILENIILFKDDLEKELDSSVSTEDFTFDKTRAEEKRYGTFLRNAVILAAAAMFLFAAGIPVYRNMETNRMIKQETRDFVASITDTDWTRDILSGDTFLSDWFDPGDRVVTDIF